MKAYFIAEPELAFGGNQPHIDIRHGLMSYGPHDKETAGSDQPIRLGIVGVGRDVEDVLKWIAKGAAGIAAKESKHPHLFPAFCGWGDGQQLQKSLHCPTDSVQALGERSIEEAASSSSASDVIRKSVELFAGECRVLSENRQVDVILCALPIQLAKILLTGLRQGDSLKDKSSLDFHGLLKAEVLALRCPIQVILPSTYGASAPISSGRFGRQGTIQDDATRMWNFYTALYYKAGGTPWRVSVAQGSYSTCHAGISFYKDRSGNTLQTSVAQLFDERGHGVILRGGKAHVTKFDKVPHLSEADAESLIKAVLNEYRRVHKNMPARLVVHKTSSFNSHEMAGMESAMVDARIEFRDFITLYPSSIRLMRDGQYPPLRGTFLRGSAKTHVLYTRGGVEFFQTYPGMYVPRPIEIRCESGNTSPEQIATEILALTKMNWNNTQFDRRDPITIRAARQVGEILKYVDESRQIGSRYAYYM